MTWVNLKGDTLKHRCLQNKDEINEGNEPCMHVINNQVNSMQYGINKC